MVNSQLLNYVKDELQKGSNSPMIKKILIEKGWEENEVDAAINEASKPSESDNHASEKQSNNLDSVLSIEKQGKKVNRKILIIPITLVVLAGAGYFAYVKIYLAPEKVFARSIAKMSEVKSFGYDGNLGVSIKGNVLNDNSSISALGSLFKLSVATYSLEYSGAFDVSNSESNSDPKTKIHMNLKSGDQSVLVMDSVNVDASESYVYIQDIADLGALGITSPSLFLGRWIHLNINEIAKSFGVESASGSDETQKAAKYDTAKQILAEENPIVIQDNLKSEEIDSEQTYHYSFSIDKQKLTNLSTRMIELIDSNPLTDTQKQNFDRFISSLQFYGGEVWIGKKDMYLRRVKLSVNMKEDNSSFDVTLGNDLTLTGFNQDQNITKPHEYVDIMDVYNDYVKSLNFPTEPTNVDFVDETPQGVNLNFLPMWNTEPDRYSEMFLERSANI